jgi:hypothetical protein
MFPIGSLSLTIDIYYCDLSLCMDQFTFLMSEISRLRIENAEMRKNIAVSQNIVRGDPPHSRSKVIMSDKGTQVMFSDNKGFEQFAGPDYGSRTKVEKAGFMSMSGETSVREEHLKAQHRLHKFSNYPMGIGNKYF